MDEKEEKLEDVMDMDKVRENENTNTGNTIIKGIIDDTVKSNNIEMVDAADKKVNEGVRKMEEMEKNGEAPEIEEDEEQK